MATYLTINKSGGEVRLTKAFPAYLEGSDTWFCHIESRDEITISKKLGEVIAASVGKELTFKDSPIELED